MKKSIKKTCAVTMLGALLVGSVPMYQGLAASKNLKVNNKNITLTEGKTKVLSANMIATFKTSNKKVVSLKNVKKKKCTLVAKKQGSCIITVKAKKQKTIKVKVKVNKKKTIPKATIKPSATAPQETEVVKVTTKPQETEVVKVTTKPQETESVKVTAAPQETEIVKVTTKPQETESVKVTIVPQETEIVKETMVPQKTSEVSVTPIATETGQPIKTLTPEEKDKFEKTSPEPMPEIKETVMPQKTESVIPTATPEVTIATPSAILPEDTDTIGGKVNNLGYNLSKLLSQAEEDDGNRVISSYSILMALTMLDNGADHETKSEIEKTLGITDLDAWNKEFSEHFKNNCNDTIQNHDENVKVDQDDMAYFKDTRFDPELSCANSFWYNDSRFSFDSKVQQDYMDKLKVNYLAQCMPLDFSNPDRNPKDDINQWVEEKTSQKIKDLLSDDLGKDIQNVLVNTLYFNGCWKNIFAESRTSKKDFYGKNETTKVDMMHQSEEYYSYYEQGSIMGIELPFYGDEDLVMDVITSKEQDKNGIAIYEQMSNTEKNKFYQSLSKSKQQPVDLCLPKFKLEYGTVDLKKQLTDLGMKQAFDEYYADFPGMRGENIDNIYVENVLHKAVIEVGEFGATAAAATAIVDKANAMNPSEKPKSIDFNVNRPFVFAIRDKETNLIYFMGQIENLKN